MRIVPATEGMSYIQLQSYEAGLRIASSLTLKVLRSGQDFRTKAMGQRSKGRDIE